MTLLRKIGDNYALPALDMRLSRPMVPDGPRARGCSRPARGHARLTDRTAKWGSTYGGPAIGKAQCCWFGSRPSEVCTGGPVGACISPTRLSQDFSPASALPGSRLNAAPVEWPPKHHLVHLLLRKKDHGVGKTWLALSLGERRVRDGSGAASRLAYRDLSMHAQVAHLRHRASRTVAVVDIQGVSLWG